ncbi:MAG: PhzF family phenazine biosynthesis protein [Methylococcales bacterium]|nr:PhzF family phenazine biosynthesis protein [Methylococcales bacterium]
MNYKYYVADIFTKEIFGGAQIAVFPNAEGLTDAQMQSVAKEFNLSETVFITNPESETNQRRMRIFSPTEEKEFAGHPVIAAAYVLGHCGNVELTEAITPILFQQNNETIEANVTAEDGKPIFVQFSRQSSSSIDRFAPNDDEIARFLSIEVSELDHNKYSPRLVSCGFPYLIVPVWNYDSVRHAKFNYSEWSDSIAPQTAASEILLFAPKSPFNDADFNVRVLGPKIGIHDDPPVGTTMPAFAAYLCSFDFTQQGTHVFAVDRGDAESRRSVLNLEMDNRGKELLTLRTGGTAVMFAEGKITLNT